jgi:hypothetical protein
LESIWFLLTDLSSTKVTSILAQLRFEVLRSLNIGTGLEPPLAINEADPLLFIALDKIE